MNKKISVCIATYNGALYIKEQLQSILLNLRENDEIIISDDHSSDDTIKIVHAFNDPRIKVVYNTKSNKGHIRNFENALTKATGDVIFLSDQDDIWLPEKAERMLEALEDHDLVVCDCIVVDQSMEVISDSFFGLIHSGSGFLKNLIKNTFLGCCMAFKRDILEKALPFPKKLISHDTWIGLIGETYGSTLFLPEKLHYFRRHGSNFSISEGADAMADQKSPYNIFEKISMRMGLLKNVIRRMIKIRFSS